MGLFTQPAGRRDVPFRFAAAGLRIRPAALPSRPSACKGTGGWSAAAGTVSAAAAHLFRNAAFCALKCLNGSLLRFLPGDGK